MTSRSEKIGTVRCPTGSLLVIDMGMLRYWSHDHVPGEAGGDRDVPSPSGVDLLVEGPDAEEAGKRFDRSAEPLHVWDVAEENEPSFRKSFDQCLREHRLDARLTRLEEQIPHLERARMMLRRGGGVVELHGHWAVVVPDVPANRELEVVGEWMAEGSEHQGRYRRATVECRPAGRVARSELLGHVWVSKARVGFFDLEALGAWQHDESLDGLADVALWGAEADQVAARLSAPPLAGVNEGVFGWVDLPEDEAIDRAEQLDGLHAEGLRFAHDYRPHSHHFRMLSQMRSSRTESGTLELAGARLCALFTTWGDGSFEVHRDLDADGRLVRLRIELGDEGAIERLERATQRAEALSQVAMVSRRVADNGAPARLVYRGDGGEGRFSGFWVWADDEPEGWGDGDDNFVFVRLDALVRQDPSLEPLFATPPRCAFERGSIDEPFRPIEDFPFAEDG